MNKNAVIGSLLGTAVGDALGLPYEGLSRQRQMKMYSDIRHRFLFGRGMLSDDTEHTCMVSQALIVSAGNVHEFSKSLAWRLRFWLLGLPAGIGYATLRAILKLWLGFPPHKSGVFSAGNGPAMRSAIIGVCYGDDLEKLRNLVKASTQLTHTDPKAEFGAIAVALAAHLASRQRYVSHAEYFQRLKAILIDEDADEFLRLIEKVIEYLEAGKSVEEFIEGIGLGKGVSGYVYHTVPVVIYTWLMHQHDYRSAIEDIIRCGGDTDTTAAITGGIIGSSVGKAGIPNEWLDKLCEWPRSIDWLEALGTRLSQVVCDGITQKALPLNIYALFIRNIFFMLVVLVHGLRRLLPPY